MKKSTARMILGDTLFTRVKDKHKPYWFAVSEHPMRLVKQALRRLSRRYTKRTQVQTLLPTDPHINQLS